MLLLAPAVSRYIWLQVGGSRRRTDGPLADSKYVDKATTAVPDNDKDLTFVVTVGGETVDEGAKLSMRNVQELTIQTIVDNFLPGGLDKNSSCTLWLQFVEKMANKQAMKTVRRSRS